MAHPPTEKPGAGPAATGRPDPADCLLLLLAALDGTAVQARLRELGLEGELERIRRDNPGLEQRMKKLAAGAGLLDRRRFAGIVLSQLSAELLGCRDPRGLSALVGAASRLPGWVLGETTAVAQLDTALAAAGRLLSVGSR